MPQLIYRPPFMAAALAGLVALSSLTTLSGCATGVDRRAQEDHKAIAGVTASVAGQTGVAEGQRNIAGSTADADARSREQASRVVLRKARAAWIGGTSVPIGGNEHLPSVFGEPLRLVFDDKPGIRIVAERLTATSGVPVRIKPDVLTDPAAARAAGVAGAQVAMSRESGINALPMRWSGTLEGYLNHITDLTGLSWEYRDGVVVIERFRTEFFELAAFEGDTSYSLGLSGADAGTGGSTTGSTGGGATTGSAATSDVSEKGSFSAVTSFMKTLTQLVKDVPGSEVVRADGSGRVAVTTSRDAMTKVREFVRTENESLQRQAQIQFDIYSIRRSESDQQGVDWNAVLNSVGKSLGAQVLAPTSLVDLTASGGVNFSVLSGGSTKTSQLLGGSKVMLDLLAQYGNSSEHRPVSLLALNRQWGRKASLNSRGYIAETTPGVATSAGAGVPGLKAATVTTGDRYVAQPYIMDNGTILLRFGLGLSSLVQIADFTSGTGSNQQKVQTPETTSVIDQAVVSLKAGQVLAITGLSRVITTDDQRSLAEGAPVAFGGSKKTTRVREDFVIFVRPSVI